MDDTRYISTITSYVRLVSEGWNKGKAPGPVALDILEIFAHNERLSAYQVFSKLKSTTMKMAYKNVHKIIQRLLSLNLLIETKNRKSSKFVVNDHNAIYYKLSEIGVFTLVLTRDSGLLIDRLSTMSIVLPTIKMDEGFFQYYRDCELFRTFLSPVMQIEPPILLNEHLLRSIYEYLHQCCKTIEGILKEPKMPFYWSWFDMVDGRDISTELLLSLREKFKLGHISQEECLNHTHIEINGGQNDELEISNPQFTIKMSLDGNKKNIIATHVQGNRTHKYELREVGSEVLIKFHLSWEKDWRIKKEFIERKQLSTLVFQMVSLIGLALKEERSGFKELARDQTFTDMVEHMYEQLEQGRSVLQKLRH